MNEVAVITGDIVASRQIVDRGGLTRGLKSIFASIDKHILHQKSSFEIYRGDSFQAVIKEPEKALVTAILIRAGLKMGVSSDPFSGIVIEQTDARIGIGIGEISYKAEKVVESDGQAFHRSGKALEMLSVLNLRLAIETPWVNTNEEFNASALLADALIRKWTPSAAEASYYYLLHNATQVELAERLNISQPAVHKRLIQADIFAIQRFIERYEKLILQHS